MKIRVNPWRLFCVFRGFCVKNFLTQTSQTFTDNVLNINVITQKRFCYAGQEVCEISLIC